MAQKTIDNVTILKTPKAMMQAVDENFTELYTAVALNTAKPAGQVHNLGAARDASKVTITNSVGTGADIVAVDSTNAGVMTPAMLQKLNTPGLVNVNLATTTTTTNVTITNSAGDNAVIPAATTTKAGAMTSAQVTTLNTAAASYTANWK